jgi:hypothetical protein
MINISYCASASDQRDIARRTNRKSPDSIAPQNFGANVLQMQLIESLTNDDGSLTDIGKTLDRLDQFFTIIFAFELALNMLSQWFRPFFKEGWSWFVRAVNT